MAVAGAGAEIMVEVEPEQKINNFGSATLIKNAFIRVICITINQCVGSETIYSGSGYSFEFP